MTITTEELGRRIRLARRSRRISQTALAGRLAQSVKTVQNWETGKTGGAWDHIAALERELGTITVDPVEPSLEALAHQLRTIAVAADTAREILYALQSKPSE